MTSTINPAAGTQSIQARAVAQTTQLSSGQAPTRAPTSAHSRTQTSVDTLFQLTARLSSELQGNFDGAEGQRMQEGVGVQPGRVLQSMGEIKEKLDALKSRAPSLGRFTDQLTAEVSQAIESGRGSNDRILEAVQQVQRQLASRYGYVGHNLNMTA